MGIRVVMEQAAHIPQIAVFDTAFHQSIPEHAYLYALPYELYERQKVRRYGFHGTSHYLGKPIDELNIITLHLGNGASAAAISGGKSIDTSMGMTPLEGLVMGTRSGDLDPAILLYLGREGGLDMDAIDALLNKQSGLKGICGENDMRTISEAAERGDSRARLALTMFCYRIRKYIGAYMAALGGVDCIVFTGGIGENRANVRQMSCQGMESLGIVLDEEKNNIYQQEIQEIQSADSRVSLLVIPTDEEYEIASLKEKNMSTHPLAGKPAPQSMLVNVAELISAYYTRQPDVARQAERVTFGTSGHRGSSLLCSFNRDHILAVTQAVCDYRREAGINGTLFMGMDTHALSWPAQLNARFRLHTHAGNFPCHPHPQPGWW